MMLNEMFCSIQGEGRYAGTPAIFIRMQGCPVRCHFCDTKHSWSTSGCGEEKTVEQVINDVYAIAGQHPQVRLVVITGGEPFFACSGKELSMLLSELKNIGYLLSIETSGVCDVASDLDVELLYRCHLTISPKYNSPEDVTFLPVPDVLLRHPNCDAKLLVNGTAQAEKRCHNYITAWIAARDHILVSDHVFVQPLDAGSESPNRLANMQAVELAKRYGWRVSCQVHKFLSIQ